MWKRRAAGKTFTFRLAGINNQNFIMRDEETGSYWQQASGLAISGPMRGARLKLAPYDELSFGLWKSEAPQGMVLAPVAAYASQYVSKDWEAEVGSYPSVVSVAGTTLGAREVVIGVNIDGAARAYPLEKVVQQSVIQDRLGSTPVLLVVGPDGVSVRVFASRVPPEQSAVEFFRSTSAAPAWELIDSGRGSRWNFQGCATSGPAQGTCLQQLPYLKDYWFDWHLYHPESNVYSR